MRILNRTSCLKCIFIEDENSMMYRKPYKLVTSFCFSFYFCIVFKVCLDYIPYIIGMYSILDSFKIFHQRLSN